MIASAERERLRALLRGMSQGEVAEVEDLIQDEQDARLDPNARDVFARHEEMRRRAARHAA